MEKQTLENNLYENLKKFSIEDVQAIIEKSKQEIKERITVQKHIINKNS
ncbi:hypothetical protein [Clostridium akagii]|nr:hypothetical protein [Clostridium akagii]